MLKAEKAHLAAVADLGCIICRKYLGVHSPASIHHCGTYMGGGRDHMKVLPLCPAHHQTSPEALHVNKAKFMNRFGTEEELLAIVEELLRQHQQPKMPPPKRSR